ncbi:hypothetical protein L3X38_007566 [Prunus dulcis]|uniref:Uncharacterized protein n=1 Tax=Prunus dulcis TaxID=3755 RepID=A0AAD4ZUX9_PRUDU|nr:hypothetical protein L3X38_007566 [Prunus dulcis]
MIALASGASTVKNFHLLQPTGIPWWQYFKPIKHCRIEKLQCVINLGYRYGGILVYECFLSFHRPKYLPLAPISDNGTSVVAYRPSETVEGELDFHFQHQQQLVTVLLIT